MQWTNREDMEVYWRMPHPKAVDRTPMTGEKRAAQFAPFAALTGYEEQVAEEARMLDWWEGLFDDDREALNKVLQKLERNVKQHPWAEITFFLPDSKKTGGKYITQKVQIHEINREKAALRLTEHREIPIAMLKNLVLLQSTYEENTRSSSLMK